MPARAETAVKVTSCAEAASAQSWYQTCLYWYGPVYGPAYCSPPDITQCWDFEGGMAPWTTTGTAFANQPTYGDNVVAWRVLQSKPSPITPGKTMLDESNTIGGDYWQTAIPIGHQGNAWVGTYEHRPSPSSSWGGVQGDGPTGTAYSPAFTVDRDYVSFLVGGGCDYTNTRVELQVLTPASTVCRMTKYGEIVCYTRPEYWSTATNSWGWPIATTGWCTEELHRQWFYTGASSGLPGRTVRVAAIDTSSGPFGHINVDHVLHANTLPSDTDGKNVPLWGIADTHAHFDAQRSMLAVTGQQWDGRAFHGSVGTITTDRNTLVAELGSCDGAGHGTNHGAKVFLEMAESASLGSSQNIPLGCNYGTNLPGSPHFGSNCSMFGDNVKFRAGHLHWGQGVVPAGNDLVGWPYWYTRTHQQMHLTWVQRAYAGGQRLMVASAVNNELIGNVMRQSHQGDFLSDYGALRRFAINMKALAAANASWMEIAYSPADARRIIAQNKLALVLATEVDDLGDHCAGDFTSTAADDPRDHGRTTSTTPYSDPWNQVRDRNVAASCSTAAEWTTRIDNLYKVGYRVIMPVHLADNDLGGTAVYSELFNASSRFVSGLFITVINAGDVSYTYKNDPVRPGWWWSKEAGWTTLGALGGIASYTPALVDGWVKYPFELPGGFINARPFTSNGLAVLAAAKARGMIIDVAHLNQLGRDRILGIGSPNSTSSPLNPGCDMNTPWCQQTAYPVISSHAAFRELQPPRDLTGGGTHEGALRLDMITRIRDIGGTVGVGVSAGDSLDVNVAAPGSWSGINASTVANNCAGSSRTFAQSYVYALRRMNGKGITLGTDFNGLEDRLNPRFGTQGCYARGNIPWALQISWDGSTTLVNKTSQSPINFRPAIAALPGGSAGAQRSMQKTGSAGLTYRHYGGTPPFGGRFMGLDDPAGYVSNLITQLFTTVTPGLPTPDSMQALSGLPALGASVTGNRTFDLNYDGYAHYGMLPDVLQDTRVVGMTNEQLSPLFQGAESFVQTWERGCRLSSTSISGIGCAGTP